LFELLGVKYGAGKKGKKNIEDRGIFEDLLGTGGSELGGEGSLGTTLARYNATRGAETEALVDQFGESHRAKLNRDFDASRQSSLARLEAAGLGSSSLQPATESAAQEAKQQSLLGLEDLLLGQRIGAKQGTTQSVTDAALAERTQILSLLGPLLGAVS
jgi:hypothetical protein